MLYEGSEIPLTSWLEEEDIGNLLHQIFTNIPLVVEMRCLLDFALSRTSLDLW